MSQNDPSTVKLHATLVEKINFACHQSAFAVLRDLQIENTNEEQDLSDLTVTLDASPAFVKQKTWRVDRLAVGGLLA